MSAKLQFRLSKPFETYFIKATKGSARRVDEENIKLFGDLLLWVV